jgi:2-methylcitrate dehydratase PrpD
MQAMQKRITTELDPAIEKMGFDKMRSRIAIRLKGGKQVEGWADERYRGGPDNPLSDADLESKVRSCCENVIDASSQAKLIDTAWSVSKLLDARRLMMLLNSIDD